MTKELVEPAFKYAKETLHQTSVKPFLPFNMRSLHAPTYNVSGSDKEGCTMGRTLPVSGLKISKSDSLLSVMCKNQHGCVGGIPVPFPVDSKPGKLLDKGAEAIFKDEGQIYCEKMSPLYRFLEEQGLCCLCCWGLPKVTPALP